MELTGINRDIYKFLEHRPMVLDAVGYGSKVIKQESYANNTSDIDLLLVVDDMESWHLENAEMNPSDYSRIGLKLLTSPSEICDKIRKMGGKMTFIPSIRENGRSFKYGIIEKKDALDSLKGKTNYFAGRRQKPVLNIKTDQDIEREVIKSREVVRLAALYAVVKDPTLYNWFVNIVLSSFHGDIRMLIGENPRKVHNLVMGAFDEFKKIYAYNSPYVRVIGDRLCINEDDLVNEICKLPYWLTSGLDLTRCKTTREMISKTNLHIKDKFYHMNLKEGVLQPIKGVFTSGPSNAFRYGYKKLQKKFSK